MSKVIGKEDIRLFAGLMDGSIILEPGNEEVVCVKGHQYPIRVFKNLEGEVLKAVRPKCSECTKDEENAREEARQYREIQQFLSECHFIETKKIRERYEYGYFSDTFENYLPLENGGYGVIHKAFKGYFEAFEKNFLNNENRGMLIVGNPGIAKSHLAKSLTDNLSQIGYKVAYRNVKKLLNDDIRGSYNHDSKINEQDILRRIYKADLVILDDLMDEKSSGNTLEFINRILFDIIDTRYNQRKPFIITSNLSLKEVQRALGVRGYDRILEVCQVVQDWQTPSYRRVIGKAKYSIVD